MGRLLARLVAAQDGWAKPLGDFNHRWLSALFGPIRPVKDFLNGTWLGHPLHPAATDLPIGALLLTVILDILGQPAAADIALVATILFMLAAAVSGAADYVDTEADDPEPGDRPRHADGRRPRAPAPLDRSSGRPGRPTGRSPSRSR